MAQRISRVAWLAWNLTYDLAWRGRTEDAIALARRIMRRRRLSSAVFTHVFCTKFPFALVQKRSEGKDDGIRRFLEELRPHLSTRGEWVLDLSLTMLETPSEPLR